MHAYALAFVICARLVTSQPTPLVLTTCAQRPTSDVVVASNTFDPPAPTITGPISSPTDASRCVFSFSPVVWNLVLDEIVDVQLGTCSVLNVYVFSEHDTGSAQIPLSSLFSNSIGPGSATVAFSPFVEVGNGGGSSCSYSWYYFEFQLFNGINTRLMCVDGPDYGPVPPHQPLNTSQLLPPLLRC